MAKDDVKNTVNTDAATEAKAAAAAGPVITKEDIEKNKVWAVVSYLGPIGIIIVLLTEGKDSPFAKFHLNQSLPIAIGAIGGYIISGMIPILGWFILWPLLSIAVLILVVMGIINAAQGEVKRLPVVGNFELIK